MAILAALTFSVGAVNAQESFGSAGLEIAIPVGDFGDFANFGIGGSGTYEVGISDNLSILGHTGVIFYATDDDVTIYQIPIQVGARYYLIEQKEGFFFSALLGLHITGVSIDGGGDSESNFSIAPAVGYFLTESLSVSARYQVVTGENANSDYFGLRAAYNF